MRLRKDVSKGNGRFRLRIFGALSLAAAIFLASIPLPVYADDTADTTWMDSEISDYVLNEEEKTLTLTSYKGNASELELPRYVSIDSEAYKVCIGDLGVFRDLPSLEKLDLSKTDMSQITDMSGMFMNDSLLKEIIFPEGFNTENIIAMNSSFAGCKSLEKLDFSMFSTADTEDMSGLFSGCSSLSLIDLSHMDMSSLKKADNMLYKTEPSIIKTPVKPGEAVDIELPDKYISDKDGRVLEKLPCNTDGSESLTRRIRVESISLDEEKLSLYIGTTHELIAKVLPEDAYEKDILWSSSDPEKVSVDEKGIITAIGDTAEREITITAKTSDGEFSDICKVTVTDKPIEVETLIIEKNSRKIASGTSCAIDARIMPEDATDKQLIFESSNEAVAAVDKDGNITAKAEGRTVIRVKTSNEKVFKDIDVEVVPPFGFELNDNRSDSSNGGLSSAAIFPIPSESGQFLELRTVEDEGLEKLILSDKKLDVKSISIFEISDVVDENKEVVSDFERIDLILSLPGKMMNKNSGIFLYRYIKGTDMYIPVAVDRTEMSMPGGKYTIEALSFSISGGETNSEYALVLGTSDSYEVMTDDKRTKKLSTATAEVSDMSSDMYFFVSENKDPDIKTLVESDKEIPDGVEAAYYDLNLTYDKAGVKKVKNFGTCEVTLPLPPDMDYTKGSISVVSEGKAGTSGGLDKYSGYTFFTDENGVQYIRFTTTHFSEYALLYLKGAENSESSQNGTSGTQPADGTQTSGNSSAGTSAGESASGGRGADPVSSSNANAGLSEGVSFEAAVSLNEGGTGSAMPKTGISTIALYRMLTVLLLAISGAIMVLVSLIPVRKKLYDTGELNEKG